MKKKNYYGEIKVANSIFIINEDSSDKFSLLREAVKQHFRKKGYDYIKCDHSFKTDGLYQYINLSENEDYFESIKDNEASKQSAHNKKQFVIKNQPSEDIINDKKDSKQTDTVYYDYSIKETNIIEKNTQFLLDRFGLSEREQEVFYSLVKKTEQDRIIVLKELDRKKGQDRRKILNKKIEEIERTLDEELSGKSERYKKTISNIIKYQIEKLREEIKYLYKKDAYEIEMKDNSTNKSILNPEKNSLTEKVNTKIVSSTIYERDSQVVRMAKSKAKGYCQLCKKYAPFSDKNGKPYIEGHHIKWLSEGGEDNINNVVALCPNCHKKMHILNLPSDVKILKKAIIEMNKKS